MIAKFVRKHAANLAILLLLGAASVAATGYLLLHERVTLPGSSTYNVRAEFISAAGVTPGLGQAVNVSGVKVGTISGVGLRGGRALVTMGIQRSKLPAVYADARADLQPVTPLNDMAVALYPGAPAAGRLAGSHIALRDTTSPLGLDDVLAILDGDTRAFLTTLLTSVGQGTTDRGTDIRRAMRAFGPTVGQLRAVTTELDLRRRTLARLVHNLGVVTAATHADGRLAPLIDASAATLTSLARQDVPLRTALRRLPGALDSLRSGLGTAATLSVRLGPALDALEPAVASLRRALGPTDALARTATTTLQRDVRPFVRGAVPVAGDVSKLAPPLLGALPDLAQSARVLRYATDELAYNPPGDDEGGLFWLAWFAHNWNSLFSTGDAHGGLGRTFIAANCAGLTELGRAQPLLDFLIGQTGKGC